MDIRIREMDGYTVVELEGSADLYTISDLKKALDKIIDDPKVNYLVLDLKNVEYMDSSGIGVLIRAFKKMKNKKGKFALLNVNQDIMEILSLASLDKHFTIYKSEAEIGV